MAKPDSTVSKTLQITIKRYEDDNYADVEVNGFTYGFDNKYTDDELIARAVCEHFGFPNQFNDNDWL